MKTINIKSILAIALFSIAIVSCKQEVITLEPPVTPTPPTPSKGNADFTKYVAIGNSLTAGFQAGALFTEGQQNSFPLILSNQFGIAQGTTLAFNQPDINSVNGYNSSYSDPAHGVILGRLVLFAANGNIDDAVPTPAKAPGVPAPYNTADLPSAYTGDKTKLNNFGVPGIILAQFLTPDTGNPAKPAYNPLWARFASQPGVKSILDDVLAKQPTFFTFDLGNNDVLGYATTGGDGSIALTDQTTFSTYYQTAIGALMTNSTANGVVATIPYVTTIPFFLTIPYNPVALSADQVTQLMGASGFGGYNQVMTGLAGALTANPGAFGLTAAQAAPIIAEIGTRHVNYSVGDNSILIKDETLINLGPFFDGMLAAGAITSDQRTALTPYQQIRQSTSSDLVPLTAGGILGTLVGNNPLYINGVSIPLEDKYILLPSEQASIKNAIDGFNATIKAVAASSSFSSRIAVADVNAAFTSFVTNKVIVADGVTISPDFTPPFGAFSEDGVHPNSRGYAYLANIFIDAINAKFSAVVPHASLADHKGVGLPLVP